MKDEQTGQDLLVQAIRSHADTIYAVPGFPVSDLITLTGATLVINEKVALEYALGDSLTKKRSCVIVKHVGMNALVDPLVHATFQGLIGGVIIVCGDDMLAKNTMTIQDCRTFGPVAAVPILEGITKTVVRDAFAVSERFSRIAILRVTADELTGCDNPAVGVNISQNIPDYEKSGALADFDLTMYGRAKRAFQSLEAMQHEGLTPLPIPLASLSMSSSPESRKERGYTLSLCSECPYRGMFTLMQMKGLTSICDTGCSLIAMNHPFSFGIASYGMGSSVAVAARSTGVALIGDYAILHSGLQGLIEAYHHKIPLLCIVMVNGCMGMTGGQTTPDPTPYLGFAHPVSCDATDLASLDRLLTIPDRPTTILVHGRCPEVINHEIVEC